MTEDLRRQTISGFAWGTATQVSNQLARFVVGIVLARLLEPAQFGLVAMTYVFIAVADALSSFGFRDALIQRQNVSRTDESSVFFFSLGVSAVSAVALHFGSYGIAAFYDQEALVPVLKALSVSLILRGAVVVYVALAIKRLELKAQFKVQAVSVLTGGGVAVLLASRGWGEMALVAQILVGDVVSLLLYPVFVKWRPRFDFSFDSLHSMFGFSSKMFLSGLVGAIFAELYAVLIGRFYSAVTLGYYSRARQLQQLPVATISNVIAKVGLPVFARLNDDRERFSKALRKALGTSFFLAFPLMMGLAAVAPNVVVVLIGEKWLPAVPLLQLFCIAGVTYPARCLCVGAIAAMGRSDVVLRIELWGKSLVVLVAVAVVWMRGSVAWLIGVEIASSVLYLSMSFSFFRSSLGIKPFEFVRDAWPSFLVAAAMGVGVLALDGLSLPVGLLLALQVVVGAGVFVLLGVFLRLQPMSEALVAFRSLFSRGAR